mmetsp:Transcript_145/g.304  ORF Transcript_145/g.304 Transcript_145/m.304 type:complete len:376 (-) Transcript_145:59-1186(-)
MHRTRSQGGLDQLRLRDLGLEAPGALRRPRHRRRRLALAAARASLARAEGVEAADALGAFGLAPISVALSLSRVVGRARVALAILPSVGVDAPALVRGRVGAAGPRPNRAIIPPQLVIAHPGDVREGGDQLHDAHVAILAHPHVRDLLLTPRILRDLRARHDPCLRVGAVRSEVGRALVAQRVALDWEEGLLRDPGALHVLGHVAQWLAQGRRGRRRADAGELASDLGEAALDGVRLPDGVADPCGVATLRAEAVAIEAQGHHPSHEVETQRRWVVKVPGKEAAEGGHLPVVAVVLQHLQERFAGAGNHDACAGRLSDGPQILVVALPEHRAFGQVVPIGIGRRPSFVQAEARAMPHGLRREEGLHSWAPALGEL